MSKSICFDMMKSFIPLQNHMKKRIDGEFTIVSNIRQEIYYLNDTARTFYELCDGKHTIDMILNNMEMEYSVERNELMSDIIELVRNMQWQDIILIREEKGSI